jgi:PTH2 family peptidyl-tRNA hydrolase
MEYKQVIVTRKDLKLSKGKLAAQVAHASLDSFERANTSQRGEWKKDGSKKVVVEVPDLRTMLNLHKKALKLGLPCALIKDAGRTELAPGTVTALGIGPDAEQRVDEVTGDLKML